MNKRQLQLFTATTWKVEADVPGGPRDEGGNFRRKGNTDKRAVKEEGSAGGAGPERRPSTRSGRMDWTGWDWTSEMQRLQRLEGKKKKKLKLIAPLMPVTACTLHRPVPTSHFWPHCAVLPAGRPLLSARSMPLNHRCERDLFHG